MKFYKSKYIISSGEKIFEDCILVVQDGKVFDIVRNDKVPENTEVIDFGNAVITPGFVNLHTHLQYTDLKPVISCHCEEWLKPRRGNLIISQSCNSHAPASRSE